MKKWMPNKWVIIGVIVGAIGGYLYWSRVGCSNGTCMITSKWHNSVAYGALMGGLLFSFFKPNNKGRNKE